MIYVTRLLYHIKILKLFHDFKHLVGRHEWTKVPVLLRILLAVSLTLAKNSDD